MDLNVALKKWCDTRLKPGMCFGGNENGPITLGASVPIMYDVEGVGSIQNNRPGKLVYQDGTVCSASHAFHDVFLLDDDSYNVYADCGQAKFMVGNHERSDGLEECEHFNSLAEVLDYLMCFCGHDPNTTGNMLMCINHNFQLKLDDSVSMKLGTRKIPILSKCDNNKKLIDVIDFLCSNPDGCLSEFEEQYGHWNPNDIL